jgi:hypothetical protein
MSRQNLMWSIHRVRVWTQWLANAFSRCPVRYRSGDSTSGSVADGYWGSPHLAHSAGSSALSCSLSSDIISPSLHQTEYHFHCRRLLTFPDIDSASLASHFFVRYYSQHRNVCHAHAISDIVLGSQRCLVTGPDLDIGRFAPKLRSALP